MTDKWDTFKFESGDVVRRKGTQTAIVRGQKGVWAGVGVGGGPIPDFTDSQVRSMLKDRYHYDNPIFAHPNHLERGGEIVTP